MRIKDIKLREFQEGKPEWMSQEDWDKMTGPQKLPPGGKPEWMSDKQWKKISGPQKLPPGGKPEWMSQEDYDKSPGKKKAYSEDAMAGATASGNIATVANPHVANPSRKSVAYTGKPGGPSGEGPVAQYVAKKQKPTDNALDGDALLMSSKQPNILRRQIKEGSLYEYGTKTVERCVKIAQALGDDVSHCYPKKPKEEKKSPWWKFWDDANIPRTEREAIGIIQEAFKMRNEGLRMKIRPRVSAPTDDFSRGGRFDPKPGFGDVEGISTKPQVDTFSNKFDPKPGFGDIDGSKKSSPKPIGGKRSSYQKPKVKKIVPDEKPVFT